MAEATERLTGRERSFPEDEIIVSKTDNKGRITYVNDVFMQVSDYSEDEVMGQAHNIVRHPRTPRCLFKLMWDKLNANEEVFVYVNNRGKAGDHYWVFAHITPNFNAAGDKVGYHSNRRVPRREVVAKLEPIYERLYQEEQRHSDPRSAMEASGRMLAELLAQGGMAYDEFILSL